MDTRHKQRGHTWVILCHPVVMNTKDCSEENPFLRSLSSSFQTAFTELNLYRTKWALTFCLFKFFLNTFLFLATCARLSWSHLAFESTLNSSIVSYRRKYMAWSGFVSVPPCSIKHKTYREDVHGFNSAQLTSQWVGLHLSFISLSFRRTRSLRQLSHIAAFSSALDNSLVINLLQLGFHRVLLSQDTVKLGLFLASIL